MRKILLSSIILLSTSIFAGGNFEQHLGNVYLGLGLGQVSNSASNLDGVNYNIDEKKDTSKRIFLGYKLNSFLSIEGHYADLGKVSTNGSAEIETNSYGLSLVATKKVSNKISLFGKLGIQKANSKVSGSTNNNGNNNKTGYLLGLGLDYSISDKFVVRTGYEKYDLDDGSAKVWGVDLITNF